MSNIVVLDSQIFMSDRYNGVWLSSDSGSTWHVSNNGLLSKGITDIATNGHDLFVVSDSGVFISSNKGLNWVSINNNLPAGSFYKIFANNNLIFASTNFQSLYMSDDNGSSWTFIGSDLKDMGVEMTFSDNYVFACPRDGIVWRRPISDFVLSVYDNSHNTKSYFLRNPFPNPSESTTGFYLNIPEQKVIDLSLINFSGQKIKSIFNGKLNSGDHYFQVETADLKDGVYFIIVNSGSISESKKFIVDR